MTTMASVQDYYCAPDLYDLIYSDIRGDIPFWVAEAKAAGGPVLELCCGTGRLLIPCLEAGARAEGLDITASMVEHCRAKLAARGLEARVGLGDMRDFERPGRYALITIAFNSFLHNLTQADQLATLARCRAQLEPGGRLMLSVFQPDPARLAEHDGTPRPIKTLPHPEGGSVRVTDTGRHDPLEQRIVVQRRVELLDPAGRLSVAHDLPFELRYVWKPEMELLLTLAGFDRFAVAARTGYTRGFEPRPALEGGDQAVWTAWKT